MATDEENENVADSVDETPGITAGRTRQERRIGSGNVRTGHGALEREVDEMPGARKRTTRKTRSTKRPTSR